MWAIQLPTLALALLAFTPTVFAEEHYQLSCVNDLPDGSVEYVDTATQAACDWIKQFNCPDAAVQELGDGSKPCYSLQQGLNGNDFNIECQNQGTDRGFDPTGGGS